MANREALRALQNRLAERMQAARNEARGRAWLAVECAGQGLLFPLHQAGEIFAREQVAPVSHAQPWFVGVANLRGGLHGVVDFAAFLGLPRQAAGIDAAPDASRLLALNPALGLNCALLVDALAGLRSAEQLEALPDAAGARPPFAAGQWRDADGRIWQEIDLAALSVHETFLGIAA